MDSHVYDSYWKLHSGKVPLLKKYETRFGFQFLIESNDYIEEWFQPYYC